MTMHGSDWAKLYTPLITELAKGIIGLIFGKKQTKERIVTRYRGGNNENNNFNDPGDFTSSGGFRF